MRALVLLLPFLFNAAFAIQPPPVPGIGYPVPIRPGGSNPTPKPSGSPIKLVDEESECAFLMDEL